MVNQLSRRQFLIAMACAASPLPLLQTETELNWLLRGTEVDWDRVLNDVIDNTNAFLAGVSMRRPIYEIGSPHWCMERVLEREFEIG